VKSEAFNNKEDFMAHPVECLAKHKQNLKRIHGIGPATELKLNQAGVFTFAQIAKMSVKDFTVLLPDVPGLSTKRISEMGWVGQARLLAKNKGETKRSTSRHAQQRSALFSIDLLIDNQNHVRRTHILHVQSLKEEAWSGWSQDQLTSFILENSGVKALQAKDKTVENQRETKNLQGEWANTKELQGDLQISEVEIRQKSNTEARWFISANEPFAVGLILDMSKTSITPGSVFNYQVEIHAKNLANGERQKIGEKNGSVDSKRIFPILVNCHPLPQGSYRLEVCGVLALDLKDPSNKSRLMAITDGRVFKVW
jgi:hypothetical protein